MLVRWAPAAADDLERIGAHIALDSPESAIRVLRSIHRRAEGLDMFPYRGRLGRVSGTRELPLPPLPFIVVYRILGLDAVEIVNVIHGSQRWPPEA